MNHRRVVVTGLGAVSSVGTGKLPFWNALLAGTSGVSIVDTFRTEGMASIYGGLIKNFDPKKYLKQINPSHVGRASQLAMTAARLSLDDAGISAEILSNKKIAIIIGTTMGETQVLEEIDDLWIKEGEQRITKKQITNYPASELAFNIAKELSLNARCIVIPTACAAGNYAIGYGYDLIQAGTAEMVIAGGADAFSKIAMTGFSKLFAVAPHKCQPFDKNRKGIVVGEGAGILIMESLESALKRDVPMLAEIKGYSLSCDASHMTIPSEAGVTQMLSNVLRRLNISEESIDYISAHGTGTIQNDKNESKAINKVFSKIKKRIPVSSIKSMLGHTMGAASALEALACVMSIQDSKIPPTINYETPDEDCDVDCVPNNFRSAQVKLVLNNSFAFGGNNACVAFQSVEV